MAPNSAQKAGTAVSSVQESRKVPGFAQEAEELVDCPLPAAMVAMSPLGSRSVVDCSPQEVMAAKTPLGSRRGVDCSQEAGMAAKGCSWVSSGGAASSL